MYDNLYDMFVSYVEKANDFLADLRWFPYCDEILCTTVDVRNHAPACYPTIYMVLYIPGG